MSWEYPGFCEHGEKWGFSVEEAEAACESLRLAIPSDTGLIVSNAATNTYNLICAAPYIGESNTYDLISSKAISISAPYEEKKAMPHNCPNCGAFLKENDKKCEYCLTEFW